MLQIELLKLSTKIIRNCIERQKHVDIFNYCICQNKDDTSK